MPDDKHGIRQLGEGEAFPFEPEFVPTRVRCRCGKWWAWQVSPTRIEMKCKLCRGKIVVTGTDLKFSYEV